VGNGPQKYGNSDCRASVLSRCRRRCLENRIRSCGCVSLRVACVREQYNAMSGRTLSPSMSGSDERSLSSLPRCARTRKQEIGGKTGKNLMAPTRTVLRRRGGSQSQQPSTLVDARGVAHELDLAIDSLAVDLARRGSGLRDFVPGIGWRKLGFRRS